jgi:DNA-binding transcriptional regulator YiaG
MDAGTLLDVATARRYATTGEGRRIRETAGLSLSEVASSIGLATSSLWRWEQGQRMPRGPRAAEWARLLRELAKGAA